MRGVAGIAGVACPRHAYQGISREPRSSLLLPNMGSVTPNPKEPGPRGTRVAPREAKQTLDEEKPGAHRQIIRLSNTPVHECGNRVKTGRFPDTCGRAACLRCDSCNNR